MNTPAPIPSNFGVKYMVWTLWSNAITILMTLQAAFASVLLVVDDPTNPHLPHTTVRWIVLGNAVLTGILAQIERRPAPAASATASPPTQEPKK